MTNKIKGTKQLGRLLAAVLTATSLFGITAAPAMAYDESWTLEVEVIGDEPYDPCLDFFSTVTPASWAPTNIVNYPEASGNANDVYADDGYVDFNVNLGFATGSATQCPGDPSTLQPDGQVVSEFTAISSDISASALDCVSGCNANTVYQDMYSIISGTLDVTSSTTPELRTGTLIVTWTPAG